MSYADKFKLPELQEGYEVNPSPPAPPPQHHCCEPETKPWEGFYYSSYGLAVKHGFKGSEEEWLASLHGKDGRDGRDMGNPFVYRQQSAADTWEIHHELGRYPSVTVVDSGNTQVIGNVQYIDEDTVVLTFSAAFSGSAYLN